MSESEQQETFDIRNFAQTIREILIWRINAIRAKHPDWDYDRCFWSAQNEVTTLRNKLERAYKSVGQKKGVNPELWMFGLVAYRLITEQGRRFDDVVKLSGGKYARLALEYGQPLVEKTSLLLAAEDPDWDAAFYLEKK